MAKGAEPFLKISPRIWRSRRFRSLETDGRLLMVYLMSCEHVDLCGVGCVPPLYAAADLQWTEDRFVAARSAIEKTGLIVLDDATDEYFVGGWFRVNGRINPSVASSWRAKIARIESAKVRIRAEQEFSDARPEEPDPKPVKTGPRPKKSYTDDDEEGGRPDIPF